MTDFIKKLKFPAIISSIIVVPLIILELINRRNFHERFPVILFAVLWILPMVFIYILMMVIQYIRKSEKLSARPVGLVLRMLVIAIIACVWTVILIDQMPCFLGIPDCD